ncbi:MAG: 4a-hydroxytetrahydrobiopterin dehydratase [Aquihabitans sp.]
MSEPTSDPALDVPEGWAVVGHAIRKEFVFADFAEAFGFMTRVAGEAERLNHHPDWSNSWNRVVIELTSHDVDRLTARDTRLAAAIDACA